MTLTRHRTFQYVGILLALVAIAAGYWYFAARAGVKTNTGAMQLQGTGDLSAGLVGYWKLDENTGTSAGDASTNGNNGTLTNGPTWTTGQIGSAVSFDGSNDYITVADNAVYAPRVISAFAWVKRSASNGRIFSKDNGSSDRDFQLKINSSNNVEFSVWNQAGSLTTVNGGSTVDTNWHFVGGTWDGTTVRTYLDGVEQDSDTLSGTSVFNGTDPLEIGRYSFNTEYFTGFLDELRLYDRVLSLDEIAALYRLTTPTGVDTSLKGYWSFNGDALSGTTAYDRSGAGNHGTLTNGPTTAEGRIGQGVSFDGTNDYIHTTYELSDSSASQAYTFNAWIKTSSGDTDGDIIEQYAGGNPTNRFIFGVYNLGYLYWFKDGSQVAVTGRTVNDNEWHMVSGVKSGSGSGQVQLYVDGMPSGNPGTDSAAFNDVQVEIGGPGAGASHFGGLIDEVRIYERALTVAELKSLYDRGTADKTNTSAGQAQGTGNLDSGLAGYWKLDENTGTSAADASTNGNTGTLTNGPTWTTGQIGTAVDFDGTNDYINAGTGTPILTDKKTVAAWVYIDGTMTNGDTYQIVRKFSSGDSNSYYGLLLYHDGSATRLSSFQGGGGAYIYSTGAVAAGQWVHVAATFDKPNVSFYINGALDSTGTDTVGGGYPSGSGTMYIGSTDSSAGYFNGKLDEVRVYDRPLSADEVARLYRLTAPTGVDTGLKGYWSFDGSTISGTTAYDRSGAGNTGTLTNGPTVKWGRVGQALTFDGSNDYIVAPDAAALDITGTITLSAWVKKDTHPTAGDWDTIVMKGTVGAGTLNYALETYGANSTEYAAFHFYNGGDHALRGGTPIELGQWYQLTATYNDTANAISLYVNGVLEDETVFFGSPETTSIIANAQSLYIGDYGGSTRRFNGNIDEVRVYNRILSAGEVKAQYDAAAPDKTNTSAATPQGTGNSNSGLVGYWKLDENTGTSVTDSSTNGNSGTLTNGPTWTTGQIGSGVNLDGTDDRIVVSAGTGVIDAKQNVTLSAWVYFVGLNSYNGIIYKGPGGCDEGTAKYMLEVGLGGIQLWMGGTTLSSNINPPTGQWSHIVATNSSGGSAIYLNGALIKSGAAISAPSSSSEDWWFGGCNTINGRIDEVRIYDRALPADEVGQLYRLATPTGTDTGLKGYWSFNGQDMAGTTAFDRSGSGNNGTLTNGPVVKWGKLGQALQFDGTNDYVLVSDAASLDITGQITLSAWIRKTGHPASGEYDSIATKGSSAAAAVNYGLKTYGANATEYISFGYYNSPTGHEIRGGSALDLDTWYHLAAVYNDTANTVELYVNGVLESETVISGTPESSSIAANNETLNIGAYSNGGSQPFSGQIDEVRVYNRALSASEIKALYSSGK